MPLSNLDGISNVNFTEVEKVVWETATDWDNASSEQNVVHADVPGGVRQSGQVMLGYSPTLNNLIHYWSSDETTSGLDDAVGSYNLSESGSPDETATGILNTTAVDYGTSADSYKYEGSGPTAIDGSSEGTLVFWANINNDGSFGGLAGHNLQLNGSDGGLLVRKTDDDVLTYNAGGFDTGDNVTVTPSSSFWNSWNMIALSWQGGNTIKGYINDTQEFSTSTNEGQLNPPEDFGIGLYRWSDTGDSFYIDGKIDEVMLFDSFLDSTQITELYNTSSSGSLETGSKLFSSDTKPNLANLDYSLNGQTINLDVIGSPGTAEEEVITKTLDGSTGYTLSWASGHTEFRLKINLSSSSLLDTPVFRAGTLKL